MATNKVVYGNTTLIDLTDSTLQSSDELVSGVTAYDRSGVKLTGTANYMDLVDNPVADDILVTDSTGQAVDSGVNIDDGDDVLNVWVNRSTYYVSTLQKYSAAFTKEHGIKVRFSLLPDESKLTYSYAAGTQPDMALGIASSVPFELGLRGALEDLTQFADFNEAIVDFAPGALVNLGADGAIYAIPETQDWQILYYRKDILDTYGLEVPNTWEEVIEMLPILQRYGANFCIPLAGGSGLKGISTTAPFIYQFQVMHH